MYIYQLAVQKLERSLATVPSTPGYIKMPWIERKIKKYKNTQLFRQLYENFPSGFKSLLTVFELSPSGSTGFRYNLKSIIHTEFTRNAQDPFH